MGIFSSIFGGSESKSSPSTVWGGQSPFLQGLYQRAYNSSIGAGSGGVPINGMADTGSRGNRRTGGQSTYIGGNPNQYNADPLQGLGQSLTQQGQGMLGQLGMMGQVGNPFAQAQIGQLGQQLGTLYNQQILPGIQSTFGQSGTLGGDRQALAMGQAAGQLGQSFTSGALDILGNSAGLALQANQAGIAGIPTVLGAGNAGVFGSLPGLASLLGGPTVLGGGGSAESSKGLFGQFFGAA